MARVPDKVRELIRQRVYERADAANYLAQGRTENGGFMEQLILDPEIGGVLREYMDPSDIKTYIKDGVLNRYAKELQGGAQDDIDIKALIAPSFGSFEEVQTKGKITLCKSTERENSYCVVSIGTFQKWETALRHALDYVEALPEDTQKADIQIALCCISAKGATTVSDEQHVKRALSRVSVEFYRVEFAPTSKQNK